jgi:hypothetical protein
MHAGWCVAAGAAGRACRSHARAVDQFLFFYRAQPARWISFYFSPRAAQARWKSCFTSAAQQLRDAGF